MAAFLFLWLKAFHVYESANDTIIGLVLLELSAQTLLLGYLVWLVHRGRR